MTSLITISEKYTDIRAYSMKLAKPLSPEVSVLQPAFFASPVKWNLAHTTWFFETFVLKTFKKNYSLFHPKFPLLFNSYYNNAGERIARVNRGMLGQPSLEMVHDYRQYVDIQILELLNQEDESHRKEIIELITLGLHHEQQHQELFWTDLKYLLSLNPMEPKYEGNLPFQKNNFSKPLAFIPVSSGLYHVGYQGNDFCYDNELGRHQVYLEDFEIADRPITKGEYLEFVEDGGYQNFNFWHDDAWHWIQQNQLEHPLYWSKAEDWQEYTLEGMQKLNKNEAMSHLSYYEAFAFAQWKGMRLPTEAEWEIASGLFSWGEVWEWTSSAYLPYPNYKKADGAVGEYNGKFMVGQQVCRGASIYTSPNHSRKTYRNFFHPNMQWQYTGIRLVK